MDWTCTVCNLTMNVNSRESHLSGQRHARRLGQNPASQAQPPRRVHPNGKYRIPIHDVADVHGDLDSIPLSSYRQAGVNVSRGQATMVTVDEYKAASDAAWDAEGILKDIDTQWGMLPNGGAYKESNHYYNGEVIW